MKKKILITIMVLSTLLNGCGATYTAIDTTSEVVEDVVEEVVAEEDVVEDESSKEDTTVASKDLENIGDNTTSKETEVEVIETKKEDTSKETNSKETTSKDTSKETSSKETSTEVSNKLTPTKPVQPKEEPKVETTKAIELSKPKDDPIQPIQPTQPKECSHSWVADTEKIWVDEKGHYETKKEPYTDYEYTYRTYSICAVCGGRFETDADIIAHFEQQQALVETTGEFGPCAGASHMVYEDEVKTPVTKYNEVMVWVVDEKGHYETRENGHYHCSKCSATK